MRLENEAKAFLIASSGKDAKYEKIGDYKVNDYVERPHEYKK